MIKHHWIYLLLVISSPLHCGKQACAQDLQQDPVVKVIVKVRHEPKPKVNAATTGSAALAAREAAARVNSGDFFGAMQVWSRVIQQGPDKLQGYLQRSKLKRQIGDNIGAVQDLDLALRACPKSVACLIERAAIRRRMNDHRGALEDLNKALEIEPRKADAYVERGWLKMATGDYVGSYTDYHTAVSINPSLKGKLGNMAQPQVTAHLDYEGNGIGTLNGTGNALTTKVDRGQNKDENRNKDENKNNDEGKSTATISPEVSANNLNKKRVYSQVQLARLNNASAKQINDGQFEEAIKTLNELIDAAPNYAHARDNLTIAHNNWGLELAKRTPTEAAKQFRQALYLDPSQGASRRNLEAMIKEMGKNPKDAEDRLAMAKESLAASDNKGAFVEASEAAKIKNTPTVRAALRQALVALSEKDEQSEKSERFEKSEKEASSKTTAAASAAPTVPLGSEIIVGETPPLVVIEQAKAMAQAGQISDGEELLTRLINHIKARAAVDESAGFSMLEPALDTLVDLYLKTGSYVQAQSNLSELIMLREGARDKDDPVLGTTYRQYARVLSALNRAAEAKTYEEKADGILDSKAAHRLP